MDTLTKDWKRAFLDQRKRANLLEEKLRCARETLRLIDESLIGQKSAAAYTIAAWCKIGLSK